MTHFYQTLGEDWFTYPNLYSHAVNNFSSGTFVEVGSWKGRSAAFMGVEIINSGKPIKLICVDTWRGSLEHKNDNEVINDTLYNTFLSNIAPVVSVLTPLRKTSLEASLEFEDNSLEFVFLDASHEYEDILADLEAWYPKVKPGGIFAGHDYHASRAYWPGVAIAVDEWMAKRNKHFDVSELCWITRKSQTEIICNSL